MHDSPSSQIAARQAIKSLGGPVRAAQILNVPSARYQTVQSWLRTRIPAEYCPSIERELCRAALQDPNVVRVTCEQLRPDVDWGVLRQPSEPATATGA